MDNITCVEIICDLLGITTLREFVLVVVVVLAALFILKDIFLYMEYFYTSYTFLLFHHIIE